MLTTVHAVSEADPKGIDVTFIDSTLLTNNNQQAKRKGGNNQVAAFLFYPALQLLNINAVRQSRIYHFLFLCQHFGGVYGCNIIEHVKPSEIA